MMMGMTRRAICLRGVCEDYSDGWDLKSVDFFLA